MRKLFLLILLIGGGYLAYQRYAPPPAGLIDGKGKPWTPDSKEKAAHPDSRFTSPMQNNPALAAKANDPQGVGPSAARFSFPNAVAWKRIPDPSSNVINTVAILDGRCRFEISDARGTIVVVFDGTRYAANYPKITAQYAEQLDPRPGLQKLYADLPSPIGVPIERLGTNECWHFKLINGVPIKGVSGGDVWVDTKTRFIRKISSVINGQSRTDTYELLPLDVKGQANQLFDTKNLQVLLPK